MNRSHDGWWRGPEAQVHIVAGSGSSSYWGSVNLVLSSYWGTGSGSGCHTGVQVQALLMQVKQITIALSLR